jgi:hypothetical protein
MAKLSASPKKKSDRLSGLGRGLSELLDDNDGIPNMKSQVVIRRDDGSRVRIYDKTGGEENSGKSTPSVKKRQ